jgi:glycerol-3-phosphate dehydrogenase (NAD(P)+)
MENPGQKRAVAVLGAGSWGTALAMVMARSGREVRLCARDKATAENMESARENVRYLPGVRFPDSLHVSADIHSALHGIEACVVALPCSAAEAYLPLLDGDYPVIAACKGLHPQSLIRTDEMLLQHLPTERIAILSGPSFAEEVARGQPTAITMASQNLAQASSAAGFFDDTNFRIYLSDDVIGVAMGGALKNVVAIAAGIAAGLGLGHNSVAAVVTRGLAEMARLSEACGGRAETSMGLSGLGDLVLTCTGSLSRNRRFGMAIARGKSVAEACDGIGQVVEGVRTAEAVDHLAKKLGIDVPLMQSVHEVLSGRLKITDAVATLMSRPERPEF